MFGWLKSLFGSEPEQERIVPPPLPSKVKKAEKLVSKKIAKKGTVKKETPKAQATKAPRKKKEAAPVVEASPVVATETVVETPKKKGGRTKKSEKKVD